MEFKYDGGGLAKGGTVSLFVDGKKDGEGRVDMTIPMIFSGDETCDVGKEGGSPVSPDYGPSGNQFNGKINWVQIDPEKADHDLGPGYQVSRPGVRESVELRSTRQPGRLPPRGHRWIQCPSEDARAHIWLMHPFPRPTI